MCGTIFGLIWIAGGIAAVIMGALGKSVDIGWKRRNTVQGGSAVAVGVFAILVGIGLMLLTRD